MERYKSIKDLTEQLIKAIDLLDDEEYTQPLKVLQFASVGEHIRHILGFFQCIEVNKNTSEISYDSRQREAKYETSVTKVIAELKRVVESLKDIQEEQKIIVHSNLDYEQDKSGKIHSSFGRELLYAFDHCVHHMAILKIAIQTEFSHIQLDNNFGVAPSTVRYKKRICAQ